MWTDNETKEDLLGFEVHAKLIENIATNESLLPITIGVFGDWGSGKSSIMKILENSFLDNQEVICLYFNGWIFEGYDDAKAALIESILTQLSQNIKVDEKVRQEFWKLARKIDWFRVAKLGVQGISAYMSGGVTLIPEIVKKVEELSKEPEAFIKMVKDKKIKDILGSIIKEDENKNEDLKFVREFREKFEDIIINTKIKSLVILIDDLDRCSPERIIDNLEAIKLFLNVSRTAFIIGADPRIVSHAIELRYGKNSIEDSEIGRLANDYLEKIIQVPYNLPKLSDSEVKTYLTLLFCQKYMEPENFLKVLKSFKDFRQKDKYSVFDIASIKANKDIHINGRIENELLIIPQIAPLISKNLKGNPRQIKRFLNAYILRKKLAEVANLNKNFKDDVMIKLMVLEYLHLEKFRKLYEWQSIQNGLPKEMEELETFIEKDESFSENLKSWEMDSIKRWIKTEPSLKNVDLRDYFWLTRDKLETAIESKLLIPPIVRNYYLDYKNAPSKITKEKAVEKICKDFTDSDFGIFYSLISQECLKDQKDESNYEVLIELVKAGKVNAEILLIELLNKVDLKSLTPALGHKIAILTKNYSEIRSWTAKLSEAKQDNRFFKALKTEIRE